MLKTKVCLFFFLGQSSLLKCKLRQPQVLWHPQVDVTGSVFWKKTSKNVYCLYPAPIPGKPWSIMSEWKAAMKAWWEGCYLAFWAETGSCLLLLSFHVALLWVKYSTMKPRVKANTFSIYIYDRPRRTETGLGPVQDNSGERMQTSVLAVMPLAWTVPSFKEAGERRSSRNLAWHLTGRHNMYVNYVCFLDMMKHAIQNWLWPVPQNFWKATPSCHDQEDP